VSIVKIAPKTRCSSTLFWILLPCEY